jgi:class 3 adenylate cyclase
MNPQVRYARTGDGVSIAYWSVGSGPALVQTPLMPFSHIEMEWQNEEIRRWYERLALQGSLVRYDGRGNGLSERAVDDSSLEAHTRDLEAVVAQLGPAPVTLMGVFHTGPATIAYAAAHPDRVSRLLLWCTYARGADYWSGVQAEGLRALRQTDYELFLRTGAHELLGWASGAPADQFASIMRGAVSPEAADRLIAATRAFDVGPRLAAIRCPTLVLHRRQLRWLDVALSRDLASRIPGASLTLLEGTSPFPAAGDIELALDAIARFRGVEMAAGTPSPARAPFRAVLFTDLVGHSEMMSRAGDARGRELLREHERITRETLREHGGTEVKTLGDGFLASFASVTSAVECAIGLQRRFQEWNRLRTASGETALMVRVGLHAGEPIEEEGDLFGATVILASRIAASAGGGEILVANAVRELCAGKGFAFVDRGPLHAKGFEEPVRVHAVRWEA